MSTGGMLLDGERTAGRDCRSANATGTIIILSLTHHYHYYLYK